MIEREDATSAAWLRIRARIEEVIEETRSALEGTHTTEHDTLLLRGEIRALRRLIGDVEKPHKRS